MEENILFAPEISKIYDNEPSMGHLITNSLKNAGDKIMMVSGISGEEVSARELLEQSYKVAKSLNALGIKKGDVISLVSENRFEFVYVLFGSLILNVTISPINLTYSEREMIHALNLSKPKIIFCSPFAADKVVSVAKSLKYVNKVVLFDDENSYGSSVTLFDEFQSLSTNTRELTPQAVDKAKTVGLILCSSGTTGLPKGVQLSQANLVVVARVCKDVFLSFIDGNTKENVFLGLLPFFHAFGITVLTGLVGGAVGKIVILPKFEESLFLNCIEYNKCSILFLVPPLMVFLAKNPMVADYDLSHVKLIICGAAPLSKELEQAVYGRLKIPNLQIRQGYGMSELTLAVLLQKKITKPGSVGDLIAGSYGKVIDEDGKALGPNKKGELCFKGNQLMIGYVNDENATAATIDKEGWLHTGDVGYYDEDKQFFIVDRIKELIKWKGFQVPPAELEAILLTHPKIKDAAVIGIPDELTGEKALGYVVKNDESLTEQDVLDHVAKTTSIAKRLHGGVIFIDEIPKNPSGKILRRELRDLYKKSQQLKSKL